jgi:Na+/glutamate symporter
MCLANIDGRLTPTEMENIMAESSCTQAFHEGIAVAGYGAVFGGMVGGSLGICYFGYRILSC